MYRTYCVFAIAAVFPIIGGRSSTADFPSVRNLNDAATERTLTTDFDLERTKSTLTEQVQAVLKATGIPSISISLIKNDSIVWSHAFGYSNARLKVPASPDTIYSTGSCFKLVTALAVMQLAESGKLRLDDPVRDQLGAIQLRDMSAIGNPVTIRHLLSHYSGLKAKDESDSLNSVTVPLWERKLPKSLAELAEDLDAVDVPGTKHRYSNYGFALAGLVVQQVSGRSYEQYITENILEPAGVKVSGPINPTPDRIEQLALPYRLEGGTAVPEKQVRFDVYPAGDAYLTVPEMSIVLMAHLNGGSVNGVSLLSAKSVVEMHTPQFGGTYGLGVAIRELDGHKLIMHAGGVPGYSTNFILDIDSKTGVYVASNAGGAHLPMRYIAQLSIDLLAGKKIGTGLVREIVGIGTALAIDEPTGLLRVTEVISNSPASHAGLSAGLIIHEINGMSVVGKSLQECLDMMAGPIGTPVRLEISQPGAQRTKTVELPKGSFLMPS